MSGNLSGATPPNSFLTRVLRRIQGFGKVLPMRLEAFFALFVMLFFALGTAPAWSQSKINFKVIPILQPMKDAAPTPDFSLTNAEGKKISLKDFRGKTLFLNFWATWCEPCREEMPAMENLYQEYKNNNFIVLAVNVKDRRQEALAFVKELKLTYPIAFDPNAEVASLYGAWGLPTTYIIGPKGEGLARGWGPAEWYSPASRNLFKELLEQKNGRR
jgi:thiol-disulfide isomerase/thioredoxin